MTTASQALVSDVRPTANRPLRILFLRNLFFPEDLGGNRYPFEVVTRMARRGHTLSVVTARSKHKDRRAWRSGNVQLRTYPVAPGHPFLTYLSHTLVAAAILTRLPTRAYDVVVAGSYDAALAAQRLSRLGRLPFVFIYHSEFYSVWAQQLRQPAARPSPAALLGAAAGRHMRWVEQQVLRASDAMVAVSEYSRQQIAEKVPQAVERVRVLPTGVDTTYFTPVADRVRARAELGLEPSLPLVLGVGRLTPVKRFERLVEAVVELRRRGLAVQLALVGDGPEASALRQLAANLGVSDRTRFAGFQPVSGVRAYMQAADLQVCSSEFEHHSLAILEALSTGLPVVGTRSGGTPEILEQVDPELLLPGSDSTSIADTVARLLHDPEQLETLRKRSRAVAEERYDWEAVVSSLEGLLMETIRARAATAERENSSAGERS